MAPRTPPPSGAPSHSPGHPGDLPARRGRPLPCQGSGGVQPEPLGTVPTKVPSELRSRVVSAGDDDSCGVCSACAPASG